MHSLPMMCKKCNYQRGSSQEAVITPCHRWFWRATATRSPPTTPSLSFFPCVECLQLCRIVFRSTNAASVFILLSECLQTNWLKRHYIRISVTNTGEAAIGVAITSHYCLLQYLLHYGTLKSFFCTQHKWQQGSNTRVAMRIACLGIVPAWWTDTGERNSRRKLHNTRLLSFHPFPFIGCPQNSKPNQNEQSSLFWSSG